MEAWRLALLAFAASTALAQVPVIAFDGDIDKLTLH
jgi:hypothetical protein